MKTIKLFSAVIARRAFCEEFDSVIASVFYEADPEKHLKNWIAVPHKKHGARNDDIQVN